MNDMTMTEIARLIEGLRSAGWEEKKINDFLLYIESGAEEYKPTEDKQKEPHKATQTHKRGRNLPPLSSKENHNTSQQTEQEMVIHALFFLKQLLVQTNRASRVTKLLTNCYDKYLTIAN